MRHAPLPSSSRLLWPVLLLVACGGGGSGQSDAPSPQPTTSAAFEDSLDALDAARWQAADWVNGAPFESAWLPDHVAFSGGTMTLTLDDTDSHGKTYSGAEYRTVDTFGHGTFQARMKAAKGSGIVSSFFLYASNGDEIDVEFLGKDTTRVQFNYYLEGVGGHEKLIDLGFDASADFHTYAIAWADGAIRWSVDGAEVWAVTGGALPSDPMKVMMNIWTGSNVAWLGPFSYTAPLHASYDEIRYAPPS